MALQVEGMKNVPATFPKSHNVFKKHPKNTPTSATSSVAPYNLEICNFENIKNLKKTRNMATRLA